MKKTSLLPKKNPSKNITHSELIKVWTRTVRYINPEILKQRNQKEIEEELLRCFKKAIQGGKNI